MLLEFLIVKKSHEKISAVNLSRLPHADAMRVCQISDGQPDILVGNFSTVQQPGVYMTLCVTACFMLQVPAYTAQLNARVTTA